MKRRGQGHNGRRALRYHVAYHVAAPLFFLSGGVALGCEAAYFRALAVLFGVSHEATGALLGAFMAGLALGSALGAKIADRLRAPMSGYALAEAVVGGYALVSPGIFERAYDAGARAGGVGRVGLAFVILALPTMAMGATLPLLAASVVRSRDALRRGVGGLYAVNLVGGVTGALVTGFVALPALGLRATTQTLGGFGIAVAIAAAVAAGAIGRGEGREGGRAAASPANADSRADAASRAEGDRLAPWIAAWIGLLSFALQVAYNRVIALLLGAAAYTFALVVGVILAATALGGAVSAARTEGGASRGLDPFWSSVSRRCLALSLSVYLGTLVVYVAPFYLAWAASHLTSMRWVRVGLVALVVGAPSYQVGALFPALASRFPSVEIGGATGRALLASTLGNVLGALGAAFVAIPSCGVEWTLGAVSALALVPALVAGWRGGRAPFVGVAIASALACALAIAARPAWDAVGLSAGSYRVRGYRAARDDCNGAPFTENRVLYFRDGPVGTVAVLGHAGGAECSLYSLRVNGKAEGSVFVKEALAAHPPADGTRFLPAGDLPSEILAGLLPAVAGAPPSRALLVGWGTGISARGLLAGGASAVEAAELEPAVLEAAALFDAEALHDPRVAIVIDDARMVLRRAAPATFDVVVSHPSNPWVVGASALFSREYFATVRDRLRAGGRLLTWIQLYEMDADSARSLVATFLDSFPAAYAFRASPSAPDVFLVGLKASGTAAPPTLGPVIGARLDDAAIAELRIAGIDGAAALAATELAGPDALARYAAGAPVNTDDNASLEYRIADHVLRGTGDDAEQILRGLAGSSRP
jgi:spermidine synthase